MKKELLIEALVKTKKAAGVAAGFSVGQRKQTLLSLVRILEEQKEKILKENNRDVSAARRSERNEAFIDRLLITDERFNTMISQVNSIAASPDYLGEVIETRTLVNGVNLQKIRVPLGVVAVIYESRPNVTIDVFALCFKSGNVAVLKGGSDALRTNRILAACIKQSLVENSISEDVVLFLDTTGRSIVNQLLKQKDFIDVIVPRGGYELVAKIADESKIPVLYHASGGARIYVDESADLLTAVSVCVNAKINRPATCNSLDTVVVHEKIAEKFLPLLIEKLWEADVVIRGDEKTREIVSLHVEIADEDDYAKEFLDYILSIKIVKDLAEAMAFIEKYSKRHTEGIIAKETSVIERFVNGVDAAGIFVNCSTRLHDGGHFGLGAEIGVATGKLHARGPVGLKELMTYKWVAYGKGQVRE